MAYRITRNLEASIQQQLEEQLATSWSNVDVVQSYAEVYDMPIGGDDNNAIICLRCGTTGHEKVEISSNSTKRTPQIFIDLFCSDDGQVRDLKDFLIEALKNGCSYYEYVIKNGSVDSKTQNGRIRILSIADDPVNFDTDKNELDPHDRFRWLITLTCSLGKVEE